MTAIDECPVVRRTARIVVVAIAAVSMLSPTHAGTFRDDFEDGDLDGWSQENPAAPDEWEVVDGTVECERRSLVSTTLMIGDASWTDYTVDYDVLLMEDHGPGDFDVFARVDAWRIRLYLFGIGDFAGVPSAFVQRVPDNGFAQEEMDLPVLDVWRHLSFEAADDVVTLSLNGEEALRYEDDLYATGSVGIRLAGYTARFDNVEISGPGVPDVTRRTWTGRDVDPLPDRLPRGRL